MTFQIPKTDKYYNPEGMTAFLQHGCAGGTMRTQQVAIMRDDTKITPATGPIPSNFLVKYEGKWRRVWISNGCGGFIKANRETINCTVNHLS